MKKKRILSVIMILLLVIGVNIGYESPRAAGASVTIALSSSSVSVGGSVTATVTVSGSDVSQYDIYVTYDSSVLQFNSGSGAASVNGGGGTIRLVGGTGSTSLSFTAIANGSCYISTSGTEVYNINYEQIAITHAGANVTVATASTTESQSTTEGSSTTEEGATTEEDDRSSNCNLKSLLVSPGTLEPEFSAQTTSYFVQLDEDATSIVVSAQAEDDKASTSVSGADNLEKGENIVSVTVTAENGAVKVYKLRVAVGDILEEAEVTIDGETYRFVNDATDIEVPELFSATTIKYKDWDIMAYESPNKKIIIVCLENSDYERSWFVYDSEGENFYPYCEYSASYNRYVIIPVPAGVPVPEGYGETELTINKNSVTAYQNLNEWGEDIYLVYAMNLSGSEGFYLYDSGEGTFMRYIRAESGEVSTEEATEGDAPLATVTDSGKNKKDLLTDDILTYIIIGILAFCFLLFLCLTIVFAVKRRKTAAQLEQAEDMIAHLTSDGGVPDVEDNSNTGDKDKADNTGENTDEASEKNTGENTKASGEDKVATIEFTPIVPSKKDSDKADKKQAYEEFKKQSAIINDKISNDYDVSADSAFSDEGENGQTNTNDAGEPNEKAASEEEAEKEAEKEAESESEGESETEAQTEHTDS